MMAARRHNVSLIDRLPPVRGRYTPDAPLAPITWFRVGGAAEVLYRPADEADLAAFLAERPADVPVTVIGVGSNIIVRDGGVPGVVVRLGRAFARVDVTDDVVTAGAGALDLAVALTARDAGRGGLEFLSGIPGTIGGAVRMNAGAYGREIKDVAIDARALDAAGGSRVLDGATLGFEYRQSALPADWIVVSVRLGAVADDALAIQARIAAIRDERQATQPVKARTGGSTFANPPGGKAWQLIDAAGCRGLVRGDAQVSEKHCNFLINRGNATAADVEGLGEEVRRRVFETTGVRLEWEIRRLGIPLAGAGGDKR
jgi:UDP-N-acetylmuramate dehydrogenase